MIACWSGGKGWRRSPISSVSVRVVWCHPSGSVAQWWVVVCVYCRLDTIFTYAHYDYIFSLLFCVCYCHPSIVCDCRGDSATVIICVLHLTTRILKGYSKYVVSLHDLILYVIPSQGCSHTSASEIRSIWSLFSNLFSRSCTSADR